MGWRPQRCTAAGVGMKLDRDVHHRSEDVEDQVLLDGIKAIRRRLQVVTHDYDIPYIAGYSVDCVLTCDTPSGRGRRHHESVGSPIMSCHWAMGSWAVIRVD